MQFNSWTALWYMDGHGPFVWSAYAIALFVLLALIVVPMRRSRRVLAEVRASEIRRSARAQATSSLTEGA